MRTLEVRDRRGVRRLVCHDFGDAHVTWNAPLQTMILQIRDGEKIPLNEDDVVTVFSDTGSWFKITMAGRTP